MKNEEWKEYEMSELIDEISMGPFGSNIKVECFVDSGIPVLNGSNLVGFRLNEDSFNYVTEEKATSLGKANAYRGDIVITHRGTLGQIVYIPQNSKYERYVISQSQFRVRCSPKVLPEYLVYYFHSRLGQHKLLSNASQVGVPSLARPTSTFQKLTIEIPSIERQKEIVKILSALDDKIELNNAINRNLEEQIQTLFLEMFSNEPSEPLGTVVETTSGGTPNRKNEEFYENGSVCWVKSKELQGSFITDTEEKITMEALVKSAAKIIPANSVMIAMYGATVGEYGIISKEMACNQAVCALLENEKYPYTYLFMLVKTRKQDLINMAVGSAQQNISQVIIKEMLVHSDLDKIQKFHKCVAPLFQEMKQNKEESVLLKDLLNYLLPKLMSNEINVDLARSSR